MNRVLCDMNYVIYELCAYVLCELGVYVDQGSYVCLLYLCVGHKNLVLVCFFYVRVIVWVDDRLLTRSSSSDYRLDD